MSDEWRNGKSREWETRYGERSSRCEIKCGKGRDNLSPRRELGGERRRRGTHTEDNIGKTDCGRGVGEAKGDKEEGCWVDWCAGGKEREEETRPRKRNRLREKRDARDR